MSVSINRNSLAAVGAAFLGLALPLSAYAQAPSGRAVEVVPDVSASRGGATRSIAALQPIFMGDRVQTGPNGQAQLLFDDNTRLVVGPGSTLLIEKYLLQSASTSTVSNFSVNALAWLVPVHHRRQPQAVLCHQDAYGDHRHPRNGIRPFGSSQRADELRAAERRSHRLRRRPVRAGRVRLHDDRGSAGRRAKDGDVPG